MELKEELQKYRDSLCEGETSGLTERQLWVLKSFVDYAWSEGQKVKSTNAGLTGPRTPEEKQIREFCVNLGAYALMIRKEILHEEGW